jgi:hypothetical protein
VKRAARLFMLALSCLGTVMVDGRTSAAAEVSGRLTSSVYGFEQSDSSHWRPYLGMNATASLWRRGNRFVSLHTNLRWTGDYTASELCNPQTYVYDLYLDLGGLPGGSRFYLGRQFAYSAMGSYLIDGAGFRQRLTSKVSLDLYGGTVVDHGSPDQVQSFSDAGMLGGRVGFRAAEIKLGLNWLWARSQGSTARYRAGLDGLWSDGRLEFYGRFTYDVAAMEVSGLLGRASVRPGSWILSGEFDWRKPSVASNSIFSVVGAEGSQSVRVDVVRKLLKGLLSVAQMQCELMSGEDSWRMTLGLRSGTIGIGWTHRDGYGGTSDGLTGDASLRLNRRVELYATAHLSQYKIQPETLDWIDDYTSSVGLVWKPVADLRLRAEGQFLSNANDTGDWRVYLQLAKGFSLGSNDTKDGR